MQHEIAGSGTASHLGAEAQTEIRYDFFLAMSLFLLLILLVGFTPSLYARFWFDVPRIPFYLHVHGAALTCWFLWLVTQASLVAVGRTDLHRRIGFVGAGLAIAVMAAGLMATLGFIPRLATQGVDLELDIAFLTWVVWGNFAVVSGFAGFVSAVLLYRACPDFHKRLMLLATLSFMGPPLARIANWPIFGWISEIPFVTIAVPLLLGPLVLHDLIVQRRLHTVTNVGGAIFVLFMVSPVLISHTNFAQAFIRTMV